MPRSKARAGCRHLTTGGGLGFDPLPRIQKSLIPALFLLNSLNKPSAQSFRILQDMANRQAV